MECGIFFHLLKTITFIFNSRDENTVVDNLDGSYHVTRASLIFPFLTRLSGAGRATQRSQDPRQCAALARGPCSWTRFTTFEWVALQRELHQSSIRAPS